jgi:hypothetical protein
MSSDMEGVLGVAMGSSLKRPASGPSLGAPNAKRSFSGASSSSADPAFETEAARKKRLEAEIRGEYDEEEMAASKRNWESVGTGESPENQKQLQRLLESIQKGEEPKDEVDIVDTVLVRLRLFQG